jgi:hypothetical protein
MYCSKGIVNCIVDYFLKLYSFCQMESTYFCLEPGNEREKERDRERKYIADMNFLSGFLWNVLLYKEYYCRLLAREDSVLKEVDLSYLKRT